MWHFLHSGNIKKPIKRRQISIFPTLSAGPLAKSTVYDKSNFLPASTKLFTDLNILKANGSVSNLIRGIPSLFQRGTKSGNVENSACTKKQSTRELIFKVQSLGGLHPPGPSSSWSRIRVKAFGKRWGRCVPYYLSFANNLDWPLAVLSQYLQSSID